MRVRLRVRVRVRVRVRRVRLRVRVRVKVRIRVTSSVRGRLLGRSPLRDGGGVPGRHLVRVRVRGQGIGKG